MQKDMKKDFKRYFKFEFILYIFGRFKLIRSITKYINNKFINNDLFKISENDYVEENFEFDDVVLNIKNNGYYDGLKLNENTLNKLLNLSKNSKLISTLNNKFENFADIDEFNKNNDRPSCLLTLVDDDLNNFAKKISHNKKLINLVSNYLGKVRKIQTKIQWSPVCQTNDDWREYNKQTVTFHYDVHDLNFVYIFFYLTDCDDKSGAHELIKGSHLKKKFFKHLIGSAKQSYESLKKDFKQEDFVIIKGKAGHGFIEDTSCFHRALVPTKEPRLTLQFRYS